MSAGDLQTYDSKEEKQQTFSLERLLRIELLRLRTVEQSMSELFATRSDFKFFIVAAYEIISRINVVLNNYLIGFHIVSLMTRKTARPPGNV
uniref:Uncharacterized protein n=1 Tax=Heterorhabditis bacteriophora TaxID=37862 RepID=A0A1I7WIB6_HETBA